MRIYSTTKITFAHKYEYSILKQQDPWHQRGAKAQVKRAGVVVQRKSANCLCKPWYVCAQRLAMDIADETRCRF